MNTQLKKWQKIAVLILFFTVTVTVVAYIFSGYHGMRCFFYEMTGFYCPGCGSGRALYAALHGDWKNAFTHNVLFLPLGLPAVLVFLHELIRLVFPRLCLKAVFVPQWVAIGCCGVVFSFWILRNISAFAFLAP